MSEPLTPRDYAKLLRPHDPNNAAPQPEADFWRKCKTEGSGAGKRPVLGRDGQPIWVTPPIIRHTGVQTLATLFGVRVRDVAWQQREPGKCAVTCEVTVDSYVPVSDGVLLALTGVAGTLSKEWPVPPQGTMQIGEVNSSNAGVTGKQYPQIFAYKRAFDRAVLDHLLIFGCYGDSEAPEFAQDADYEARRAQPAAAPVPTHSVSNAEWRGQSDDIRDMVKALMQEHSVPRKRLDQLYLDVAGESEPLAVALASMLAHQDDGPEPLEEPDLFGGQGDDK